MDESKVKHLAEQVINFSTADETEVIISGVEDALTRFAENVIHQNLARKDVTVIVRAVLGNRMAEAVTNQTDEVSLKETTQRAVDAAKQMPQDENLLPRLNPQSYLPVHGVDQAIFDITPQKRAELIKEVIQRCESYNTKAAGALKNGFSFFSVSNSNGLYAFYERTDISFSITVATDEGTGWASSSSFRMSDVDVIGTGERALQKAVFNRNPRELPPGNYSVVLETNAVADLLLFLATGFNALSVDEQRSWLSGKMGQKVLGENITIISDVYHPLHQSMPFDVEGFPTKKVILVDKGVAEGLVYDRLTAQKHKVEPTGHSIDPKGSYGAFPRGLVMNGNDKTLSDLIHETNYGLLVTRLWYIRTVDPMKVLLTGMTRDGLFLIEGGQITSAIKNFRFNQSVVEMLNKVEALSYPERAGAPEWEWSEVVPAMRVSDFQFTDVTVFAG